MRHKPRKNTNTGKGAKGVKVVREILEALAGGTVIGLVAATSPFFVRELVKGFLEQRHYQKMRDEQKYMWGFRYIISRELIEMKEADGMVTVVLTAKGEKRVLRYNLEEMKLKKSASWDHKWRIVIYDVPSDKRTARNALNEYMKRLGFYRLQKSVWIYPYECRDEIDFVSSVFEVREYCLYITANRFEYDKVLTVFFKL
ncbi:MAG: CRISPR-associated endonuclease Cas2 [Parcubacteria group bacterium RIFCSPLOWO2_01_FULL_48_18]|nr:MAG: CRISPR-associated endonuclease Cas2 [Parcubacteria group bacterium RIFCSPHIGHO2_02_FULL_48_10b]OHB22754.1 MAG: CRISPR-associated endonuclease Cas2 [Parcubacteria group bacterium RIFCSPLOWO2_01_FULL_48_18]